MDYAQLEYTGKQENQINRLISGKENNTLKDQKVQSKEKHSHVKQLQKAKSEFD